MKLKKVSLVLVCALLLSLVMGVFSVSAADTALTEFTTDLDSGDYYLSGDLELVEDIRIRDGAVVTIDLKGFALIGSGNDSVIRNDGTLEIKDTGTATAHYFKVNEDGLWELDSTATSGTAWEDLTARPEEGDVIKVTGGVITGGCAAECGGGINNVGNLTLSSGSVVGNMVYRETTGYDTETGGGGVYNSEGCRFTMTGGAILGNFVYGGDLSLGGGVCNYCIISFSGNTFISYNTCFGSYNSYGGGLYNGDSELGGSTLTGCHICGNRAAYGGGIYNAGDLLLEDGDANNNSGYNGGGICNSTFLTLSNGFDVCENYADNGGGIFNDGYLNLSECGIIANNSSFFGAGVYNGTSLLIGDGTVIKQNTVTADDPEAQWKTDFGGAGIYFSGDPDYSSITVSGCVKITNNITNETQQDNLFMYFDSLDANIPITVDSDTPLASESVIGITHMVAPTAAAPIAVTGDNGADYSEYFKSDESAYSIINDSNTVKLTQLTATAEITETGVQYASVQAAINAAAAGQTVKLIKDVTENVTVASGDTLTIDLNGHVINGNQAGNVIINNGTLEIKDSGSTAHYFKVGSDGLWTLDTTATSGTAWEDLTARPETGNIIKVSGGVITGGSATIGGGIYSKGTLTLSSVNIVGNKAVIGRGTSGNGGGVYNYAGKTCTVNGGAILGNSASKLGGGIYCGGDGKVTFTGCAVSYNSASEWGGGVYNSSGTATLTGCTVSGNTASSDAGGIENNGTVTLTGCTVSGNSASEWGGGIKSNNNLTLNEGTVIKENTVTSSTGIWKDNFGGAGIDYYGGSVTLSGKVIIKDNKTNGAQDNIFMDFSDPDSNIPVTVDSTTPLAAGSEIGITHKLAPTAAAPIAVTGSNGTNDYSKYFTSDNTVYSIYNSGTQSAQAVYLGNVAASIEKDGFTAYYGSVQSAIDAAASGDTVKVLADVTEVLTVASDDNLTLDLNGHVINGNLAGSVITNNGTLEIKDSGSTAHYFKVSSYELWTLDTTATSGTDWTTLSARPSSGDIIKVSGGVITGGGGIHTGGGTDDGAGIYNNGTLTLSSGSIVGNNCTDDGGGVYTTGAFSMTGGAVLGNASGDYGGGVYINGKGTWNMSGGTVGYNKSSSAGAGICICTGTGVLSGGTIIGNKATSSTFGSDAGSGAGVYVGSWDAGNPGLFTMTGGLIKGNEANAYGGGIGVNTGAVVKLLGGTVTGNKAPYGGGGVESGWTANNNPYILGGDFTVTGNTLPDGTTANNLYLHSGYTVSVADGTDSYTYTDAEGKTKNIPAPGSMSVGVTTETAPTAAAPVAVTNSNGTNDYSAYFTSDNTAYSVYNDTADESAQVVKLGVHEHVWTYAVKEGTTDTLAAVCTGTIGTCNYAGSDTEITVIASDAEYDEAAHGATLSATSIVGVTEMPAIQYEGVSPTAYTKSTDAPKDVGTYRASLTLKDSKGTETTAYADYSIAQTADTVKTAPAAISGLIYNGFPQTLITAGEASHGTMLYALGTDGAAAPETGWSADLPLGTKAGDYYVWYKSTGDGVNYGESVPACVTATIKKAPITVSNATFSYTIIDGKAEAEVISLVFDGLMSDDTLVMNTDYEVTATLDNPTLSKATKVTVTVTLLDTAKANNYSISASQDFAIDEKPVMLATVTPAENTVKVGHKATFKVTLAKQKEEDAKKQSSYTYQWYVNRNDGYGYVKINGATGKSYTTAKTLLANNGFTYQVAVTDNYNRTSWSNIATLYVVEHDVPGTGDASRPALWLSLSVISLFGAALLLKKKKAF